MTRAQSLRNETALNSITPERAGSIMFDTASYINQMQLQGANPLLISKVYDSVASMGADDAPVSDITGEPLRPGQIVCIATDDPDDPENGLVYRYDGTEEDTSSWTAVGRIGSDPYLSGYLFMGTANLSTTPPASPTQKICYIAVTPGVYENFNNLVVQRGEVAMFLYSSSWTKIVTGEASFFGLLASRSFAGQVSLDFNHIVDSSSWEYKESSTFDAGWVQIFEPSGKIIISGAAPYRITFYNSLVPDAANKISSITVSNISPAGNDIPSGAVLAVINFRHVDNASGYDVLAVSQPGAGASNKAVDEKLNDRAPSSMMIRKVVGKNLINPDDVLRGYRWSSDHGFEANADGILSNKLYLRPGKYTIQGVKAYSGTTARVLLFDDNDNFLTAGYAINLDANNVGVYEFKCSADFFYAAYARIMLQYSSSRPFDASIAQFERGDVATTVEPCQTELFPNPTFGREQKTVCLSGASMAMTSNGWFENACERLGYKHYNVSVSGESIVDAANKLWRGTLFGSFGASVVDALVLSHTHNQDVASTASTGILVETVAEYEAKGYDSTGTLLDHAPDPTNANEYLIAPGGGNTTERYAAAFDYVLKKWAEMCLAEKDDESSQWYGTKSGKPCVVIICSHWHDARVTYNDAAKILANRHGALYCDFASNVGFSYQQTDPSDPNSVRQSALYCNNAAFGSGNDTTTEVINGVSYTGMGWHPTRDAQSFLTKKRGYLLAQVIKTALGDN